MIPVDDLMRRAEIFHESRMFPSARSPEQVFVLLSLAESEGRHPACGPQRYGVLQRKNSSTPYKKAGAIQADFQAAGGKLSWEESGDQVARAKFSHPSGGEIIIEWSIQRVKKVGLYNNPSYKTYPEAMLRARVIAEGVRAVFPGATEGLYVKEEVEDFDTPPPPVKVKPTLGTDAPASEGSEKSSENSEDPEAQERPSAAQLELINYCQAQGWKGQGMLDEIISVHGAPIKRIKELGDFDCRRALRVLRERYSDPPMPDSGD